MTKKMHFDSSRADALYRFVIALLMLVAFGYQQLAMAQTPVIAHRVEPAEATAGPAVRSSIEEGPVARYASKDSLWWTRLDQQFAASLGSPIKGIREGALQNAIFFAYHYGGLLPAKKVTPKLLDIYLYERDEAHRIMALAALHAMDDKRAMQVVAERVMDEKPGRLRRCTFAALADHLEKNPDIARRNR